MFMLSQIPESAFHKIRWTIVLAWLLLIFSLLYDPFSPILTDPQTLWSPLRDIPKEVFVQGKAVVAEWPYPIAARLFWGMTVPSGIFVVFVLGHEFWRRICPLYFLSQLPRALGLKPYLNLKKNKWLQTNHLYLQFVLLLLGIIARILFINSDRFVLASFLIATIVASMGVIYLYGGRSWCHYVCPFGAVQMVFTGPRGLLDSEAHGATAKTITQSMCRSAVEQKPDKVNCVGCKTACFDIDAEKNYWNELNKPGRKLLQYGYLGIVIGFILYYYLYAGNWDYYFSGIWTHEAQQLASLGDPGLYLWGNSIALPKLLAAPLVLTSCALITYGVGLYLEKTYTSYLQSRSNKPLETQPETPKQPENLHPQAMHQLFSLYTFVAFNIFFLYGGRLEIQRWPLPVQFLLDTTLLLVSSLWLYRTWNRSSNVYTRESLANNLRRQLSKLKIDYSKFLEGRTLDSLKPDEVYVLAKILPDFSEAQSFQVYKGVLKEGLEQGNFITSSSLEVLKQMRQGLGITEGEHFALLEELGIEDPSLLDPSQQRSRENQLRLESYRQALEAQLLAAVETGASRAEVLKSRRQQTHALGQAYGLTTQEEEQILQQFYDRDSTLLQRSTALVEQLEHLRQQQAVIQQTRDTSAIVALNLLQRVAIQDKQKQLVKQILGIADLLEHHPEIHPVFSQISKLSPNSLRSILEGTGYETSWYYSELMSILAAQEGIPLSAVGDISSPEGMTTIAIIEEMLHQIDPLVKALSLYTLSQINLSQGQQKAQALLPHLTLPGDWMVQEMIQRLLQDSLKAGVEADPRETNSIETDPLDLTTVEKLIIFSRSRTFGVMHPQDLIELAQYSHVRCYQPQETICTAGEVADLILLLFEGAADVFIPQGDRLKPVNKILPGETIGELGVLTREQRSATVIATVPSSVLVIEANNFETALRHNYDLSKSLLMMLIQRIQRMG